MVASVKTGAVVEGRGGKEGVEVATAVRGAREALIGQAISGYT